MTTTKPINQTKTSEAGKPLQNFFFNLNSTNLVFVFCLKSVKNMPRQGERNTSKS